MLMLYNGSDLSDDTNQLNLELTDEENEKITTMMSYRSSVIETFSFFGKSQTPSIVIDDFLFLGNIGQASNRELLTQLDISKLLYICTKNEIFIDLLFYELEHIINVCDIPLRQDIVNDFDVVHIVIQDMPEANIKMVEKNLNCIYMRSNYCLI